MSDNSNQPDPPRRRAGLLSALTRIYSEAHRLMKNGGSPEEVAEIRTKIEDRYTAYLESHELTLAEYPDRETSLVKSHDHNELKYQLILDNLDAYIAEGSEPEDIGSLHAASLFSVRSTATRKSKQALILSLPNVHQGLPVNLCGQTMTGSVNHEYKQSWPSDDLSSNKPSSLLINVELILKEKWQNRNAN